jgi:isopentenyl-diphosphate Delta-isomerase
LGAAPGANLTAAGTLSYEADDPASGLVEREFDHLFVGLLDQVLHPDPTEVAELARWPLDEVIRRDTNDPDLAAWFGPVFRAAYPALLRLPRSNVATTREFDR